MPGMWRSYVPTQSTTLTTDRSTSVWEQSNLKAEPAEVSACEQGCDKYLACMTSLKTTVTNKVDTNDAV